MTPAEGGASGRAAARRRGQQQQPAMTRQKTSAGDLIKAVRALQTEAALSITTQVFFCSVTLYL